MASTQNQTSCEETGGACRDSYDEMASLIEVLAHTVFSNREDAYPEARRVAHFVRALIDARIDMAIGAAK